MTVERDIAELYSHGWNRELVKIIRFKNGIKVKGSLSRMNWGDIKLELYDLGYVYDKEKKYFRKMNRGD